MLFGVSAIVIILYVIYPVSVIAISIHISRNKEMSLDNYFYSNKNTHWLILGVSFITLSIFSPSMFALLTAVSASGIPLLLGITTFFMLAVLGWIFAPSYFKMSIKTLPEYFEKRFNRTIRLFLSALYIVSNLLIRLTIIMIAGRFVLNTIAGTDAFSPILFFLVITGVYVIIGGLRAELYVNLIQFLFIAIATVIFSWWLLSHGESFNWDLYRTNTISYMQPGININSGIVELMFGIPLLGFWFWCADQLVLQRVVSTKNPGTVKKAVLGTAFLQIFFIILLLLPAFVVPSSAETISRESARIIFAMEVLPDVLRGSLMIAAAGALMASLAGLFNSTSSLVIIDFYKTFNPDSSDRKLVLIGRMTIMLLMFYSILLIPLTQLVDLSFCLELFKMFTYMISVIAAVFIVSIINSKINSFSALITLSLGFVVAAIRILFEIIYRNSAFEYNLSGWFVKGDFFVFSAFLFLFSAMLLFLFNGLRVQNILRSIPGVIKIIFLKIRFGWNMHKSVLIILSAVLTFLIVGIIQI